MNMMVQIASAIYVEVFSSLFLSLPHNDISLPMGSEIRLAEFKEPHLLNSREDTSFASNIKGQKIPAHLL